MRPLLPAPSDCIGLVLRSRAPNLLSSPEIDALEAKCEAERALCLLGDDGLVVVEPQPDGDRMQMFVRLAVGFRVGAYKRQGPALLQLARDLGASTIAFGSERRGWSRYLGPDWVSRGGGVFAREVPDVQ